MPLDTLEKCPGVVNITMLSVSLNVYYVHLLDGYCEAYHGPHGWNCYQRAAGAGRTESGCVWGEQYSQCQG